MESKINDLQIGKAGEYLTCFDLILKGHVAFPTEQGLSFDVVLVKDSKMYKIQVKTTRTVRAVPQRLKRTEKYLFHVKRCGKGGMQKYSKNDVDIFALVALDTKTIGYVSSKNIKGTMFFLPEKGEILESERGKKCACKKLSDYTLEACL